MIQVLNPYRKNASERIPSLLLAILAPLEEAVSKNRSSSGHHVDNERERTYNLAGSVDAQIKLLAQDLREV